MYNLSLVDLPGESLSRNNSSAGREGVAPVLFVLIGASQCGETSDTVAGWRGVARAYQCRRTSGLTGSRSRSQKEASRLTGSRLVPIPNVSRIKSNGESAA